MMKKQKGAGGVLFIALLAIISAGLIFKSMMVENQSEEAESEVTGYAQQFLTIQNRAMHFYKDNGLWPGSLGELNSHDNGKYNTGITVSITGNDFVFDTSSGWLQIQSNTNDRGLADSVASLLVSGESNNGVVSSTLKNPYEVDAYEDYLQKVANPDDPSRTRLETDVDFNHNELTNAGNVDGESIDFNEYEGRRASTEVATVDDKARIGQAELTAIGRSLNINGELSFRDMKAQVARFNELEVERGDASQFEGDDFSTQDTSLNAISYQANALENKLDECMYVTEWCFPKAPKITQTVCEPDCVLVQEGESFSTRIRARVSQCQHGCKYSWQIGSASGTCQSGNISQGGYRNLSCNISGSVPPQSTRSHSIKLTALNSVDNDKRTAKTIPVSWENTMANTTFSDIAGYREDVQRFSGHKSIDIYPTINDEDYYDWNGTDCANCEWSYTVSNVDGQFRHENRDDHVLVGAENIRCEDTRGRADLHLKIYNPENGDSVSWTIQIDVYNDGYDPRDCGG